MREKERRKEEIKEGEKVERCILLRTCHFEISLVTQTLNIIYERSSVNKKTKGKVE